MQDFASKRNALFASLDDASKELKGTKLDQSGMECNTISILQRTGTIDGVYRNRGNRSVRRVVHVQAPDHDINLSRMRGKESIFKKPELPIGKCLKPRRTPDFQMNPHKWKKYSLSDVDISEQTNNSAAFAFLKELDERRDEQMESTTMTDSPHPNDYKIEFKKSSKIKRQLKALSSAEVEDVEVDKPRLKGSKFVMPEYVVGKRADKKKKPLATKLQHENNRTTAVQLTLTHLQEDEDVEKDDDEVEK